MRMRPRAVCQLQHDGQRRKPILEPRSNRKALNSISSSPLKLLLVSTLLFIYFLTPSHAAFLSNSSWSNCLSSNIQSSSQPQPLQWVPEGVWATFNASGPAYNLNITVYGNVTGQTQNTPLPPPGSPDWSNTSLTYGKIPDQNNLTGLQSTLRVEFDAPTSSPFKSDGTRFCDSVINNQNPVCPIAPFFPGK